MLTMMLVFWPSTSDAAVSRNGKSSSAVVITNDPCVLQGAVGLSSRSVA